MGIQSIWDRVNTTKLKMLVAGLNSSDSFYYEAMIQRVSDWHGSENNFWQADCPGNFKGWIQPLWKWMKENNIGLQMRNKPVLQQPKRQNDFNLIDVTEGASRLNTWLRQHKIHWLSELASSKRYDRNKVMSQIRKLDRYDSDTMNEELGRWYADGKIQEGETVANMARDRVGVVRRVETNTVEVGWNGRRARRSARNIDSEQNHWAVTKTEEERSTEELGDIVRLVEAKAVGKQRSISGELIERVVPAHASPEYGTAKPLELLNVVIEQVKQLKREIRGQIRVVGGSDGSVLNDKCSYGWTLGIQTKTEYHPLLSSGACLPDSNYKASSTRAEGMGILCGVILAAKLGRKLRWYCDSKAAGDRYRKLDVMTPEEWEEVQSADVWREISHYKSIGPGVKVQWVRAHTDDKKRPHYLPPERRKAEHKINIVCDQLAAEHRDDVLETAPGGRAKCAILYHGQVMGKPPKELLEEIQWRRIVKHMERKPHVWGDVSKLNMDMVQDMLKTKSRYQMVRQMKLRWGLMATRHVMMIQRRVLPQENRCPL